MPALIRCAYVRVYTPMEALPAYERKAVEQALRAPAVIGRAEHKRYGLGLLDPDERKEVYEFTVDDERFVCPAHTRLRALLGMLAFDRAMPDGVAHLFFRPGAIDEARQELDELQTSRPQLRPYVVQSPWHVPLRWFVCFDDSERRIEQEDEHLRIRYLTTVREAQARVARALDVLGGGTIHPSIVGMVYELREWVEAFDERSWIELDYASVSTLFSDEELADDHSASDVWSWIYALASDDGMRAGLYYQRANERWSRARGRETLN